MVSLLRRLFARLSREFFLFFFPVAFFVSFFCSFFFVSAFCCTIITIIIITIVTYFRATGNARRPQGRAGHQEYMSKRGERAGTMSKDVHSKRGLNPVKRETPPQKSTTHCRDIERFFRAPKTFGCVGEEGAPRTNPPVGFLPKTRGPQQIAPSMLTVKHGLPKTWGPTKNEIPLQIMMLWVP